MDLNLIEQIINIWKKHSVGAAIFITMGATLWSLAMLCLRAWIVMLLWNWVAVGLFGAPAIGFWMALGLRWLCSMLFKSSVTVNKKSE